MSYDGANELKSVGFNAFNGIYAKVIGGQQYHALGNITSIGFTKEIDGETTEVVLNDEGRFTPETDGYVYAEGTDICIHLTHTYTPDHVTVYQEDILKLPDVKSIKDKDGNQLFPYGLLSAGSVHDEIAATKAIKRVNRVVLNGSEYWELRSINTYGIANFSTAFKNFDNGKSAISDKFQKQTTVISVTEDEGFLLASKSTFYIRIKSTTASTVEQFKAWLSQNNVIVQTGLAEPIEVDLEEPLNLTYEAWDFGTEELHTEAKTTPLNADISYQFNAVDRIRENTTKASDLEVRIAQLEAMLTQMAQANESNEA